MSFIFRCIAIVLTILFLTGCTYNQLDVNLDKVTIDPVVFKRLDKDVFALTQNNIKNQTSQLQKKYSTFYNRFVKSIINNGGIRDSIYEQSLLKFVNDNDMRTAYSQLVNIYNDDVIQTLNTEMTDVVKRFKVFFPSRKIPKQYVTFMSGFNYNVVYVDSTLGVGLEMYLGSNNDFYKALQMPKYKSRTMNKEHLLSDVVRGWLITEFDNTEATNTLLSHMIFYGKIAYVSDGLLPNIQDSVKMAYTSAQMEYCEKYESKLWSFIAKDDKLFANDLKIIAEFTNDGPNLASAISKECPPRIAMWLGWQLVKSYMKHNEKVTVNELMQEMDVQKILTKSKYRP